MYFEASLVRTSAVPSNWLLCPLDIPTILGTLIFLLGKQDLVGSLDNVFGPALRPNISPKSLGSL